MDNQQELIVKAIQAYDYYSESQRKTLTMLYQLSIDNIATIKVATLADITGYSRYMIYKNLKQFAQDGILKFSEGGQKIVNTFKFNENKLQSIVDVYQKRLEVISEQKSHGE